MTEYWVSKQSYFCKYCEIYIRDDKPSRAQHENGLRHKGNLERYIRDIYKKEERIQKERADEAIQISKINEAARLAHEKNDLSIGGSSALTEKTKGETDDEEQDDQPQKRAKHIQQDWKGAEDVQNYSDARSLGLIDEHTNTETEAAVAAQAEKEARSKEGLIGKWEAVVKSKHGNQNIASSSKPHNYGEKLVKKLSGDRDPDKKPIRKLFSERNFEMAEESLDGMEIKLKVDRRSRTLKLEDADDASAPLIHGSLRPIRLDGLEDDSSTPAGEIDNLPAEEIPMENDETGMEDVKPKLEELDKAVSCDVPAEPTVLFKKRKATKAQPRQKPWIYTGTLISVSFQAFHVSVIHDVHVVKKAKHRLSVICAH